MKKPQKFFQNILNMAYRCLLRFSALAFVLFYFVLCSSKGIAEEITVRALCYGPGLFGQRTASGQILTRETTGVAHRRIKLGSNIKLRYQGQELETKVIDRGFYIVTGKQIGRASCRERVYGLV